MAGDETCVSTRAGCGGRISLPRLLSFTLPGTGRVAMRCIPFRCRPRGGAAPHPALIISVAASWLDGPHEKKTPNVLIRRRSLALSDRNRSPARNLRKPQPSQIFLVSNQCPQSSLSVPSGEGISESMVGDSETIHLERSDELARGCLSSRRTHLSCLAKSQRFRCAAAILLRAAAFNRIGCHASPRTF